MKLNSPLTRSIVPFSCFLLQFTITAASSANHHNHQHQHESLQATLEAARYSTLPPTVFAPGGRLHGVERVAKEAMLLDVDASGGVDEDVSCGVLALHCRGANSDNDGDGESNIQNDDNGDFAVMVGIGATSPFLHRDESYLKQAQQQSTQLMDNDSTSAVEDSNVMEETYLPLLTDETTTTSTISTPLSILSPTLIAGAGGKAIDSIILLRRTMEVALSMYANDNGGVDWFVSHSLEGTIDSNDSGQRRLSSSLKPIMGGVAGVDVSSLVRRVADMAQSSTQSLGGRYGRMLSSSLIAVGVRPSNPNNKGDTVAAQNDPNNDSLILWRVDPTGQFWRLDASAVGRGAMNVESELLQRVKSWRMKQNEQHNSDESECDVLHDDVRAYLGSLSAKDAVEVATDCLINGIMKSKKLTNSNDSKMMSQLEQGLRKRVQAVVIRSNEFGQSKPCIEIV